MTIGTVDYDSGTMPENYVCCKCSVEGAKLWRDYNTFGPQLYCCDCAREDQKKDVTEINEEGKRPSKIGPFVDWTDQIGWLIPAVPCEEGGAYWG